MTFFLVIGSKWFISFPQKQKQKKIKKKKEKKNNIIEDVLLLPGSLSCNHIMQNQGKKCKKFAGGLFLVSLIELTIIC